MDLNNLFSTLKTSTSKIIYYDAGQRKEKKFSEVYQDVKKAASYLKSLSLSRGDLIGIHGKNCYEWVIVDLACISGGFITVPLETNHKNNLAEKIDEFSLSCIFTNEKDCLKESPKIKSFFEIFLHQKDESELSVYKFADNDIFTFNFTSGTSGIPKAIEVKKISFDNLVQECQNLFNFSSHDKFLVFLPLNVYLERCYIYSAILIGFDVILTSPQYVFKALQTEYPTVIIGVPYFFENVQRLFLSKIKSKILYKLLYIIYELFYKVGAGFIFSHQFILFSKLWGGKVRYLLCGSAPLKKSVIDFYNRMGIKIYEGYGMNEIGGMITLNSPENVKLGSVGKPFPGKDVTFDEEGQIFVESSYHANNRYFRDIDNQSQKTYLNGSKVATGDVGYADDEGFVYITGRIKDIIILSNGIKVHPSPLEEQIESFDGVKDCCIYGDDKPFLTALIVKEDGMVKTDIGEKINDLNQSLPEERKINKYFVAQEPFSNKNGFLTDSFKRNRKQIYKHYKQNFEELY